MRVIEATTYGGPDVLELTERPDPRPTDDQVLVRVTAATVNPVDWLTRAGALSARTPHLNPPLVLGWDFAGVIETGGGSLVPGQRVVGSVPWFSTGQGTYAERIVVDPAWLVPIPDAVDDITAAAVPLNATTARQALDLAGVQPGHTVLITGASGAVGGFAVQLATAAGATVLAVASAGDEEYVAGLGAKEVLGRAEPAPLAAQARGLAGGALDAVLDAVPAGPALIAAVRDGGHFVTVLDSALPPAERGIQVAKVSVVPDQAQLRDLVTALAAGRLATRVADVLPLAAAAEAHRRAEAGGVRGKFVLRP